MVFSSNFFILLFLPTFLLGYYALPMRWRSLYILLGSWGFYAWWRIDFLSILITITLWNFWIGQQLDDRYRSLTPRNRTRWLTLGLFGNLLTLGYFKYFNFGLESWNSLMISLGRPSWHGWEVILPIGISFFTFQSISYLIDVYRRDTHPAYNLINFAAFVALFPQLIAGPVLRYKDIEHQFIQRSHTRAKLQEGLQRFIIGLAKKVLIADSVAPIADALFALEQPTFCEAWLGVAAYTVQLYFDFSGYSCMAIGLGLMMGFRFIENFNTPYRSHSITEFWQRWHISLSTWLRDYLYVPLGGNRKGKVRTYCNLGLTMLLGGLWHGAGWTFILWGAWHGTLLALERGLKQTGLPWRAPGALGTVLTMALVMIGWTLFRASDLDNAANMLLGMSGSQGWGIGAAARWQLPTSGLWALVIGLLLIYPPSFCRHLQIQYWPSVRIWLALPLYILSIMLITAKLGADSHSPFLYFQF